MKISLENLDLEDSYNRAARAFAKCIVAEDADSLECEIGIPLTELVTKNEWINLKFELSDKNHFLKETRLALMSPSNENLGYYCYHEDENEDYVDDFLVFN